MPREDGPLGTSLAPRPGPLVTRTPWPPPGVVHQGPGCPRGWSPGDYPHANPGPLGTSRSWTSRKVVTWGPGVGRSWFSGDHLSAEPGYQRTSAGLPPDEAPGGWIPSSHISREVAPLGTSRARGPGIPGTTQGRTQPRGHASIKFGAERAAASSPRRQCQVLYLTYMAKLIVEPYARHSQSALPPSGEDGLISKSWSCPFVAARRRRWQHSRQPWS